MGTRQAFRISSTGIEGLGRELGEIADYLEVAATRTRAGGDEEYGFPSSTGWSAMDHVLGDYELARVRLCEDLRGLRSLAQDAGGCFLLTESAISSRHRGIE